MFKAIIEKNRTLITRGLKFGIVGCTNTALTFILYSIFVLLGIQYNISVIMTAVIGVLYSAHMNNKFTFNDGRFAYTVAFIGIYVLTVSINVILLNFLVTSDLASPILAQLYLTLPIAALTFLLLWVAENVLKTREVKNR